LLEKRYQTKDIMTREAFENAITMVAVLGGSNAVMHLIAMAHSVNIEITLDDFQRISDKTPLLADLKPSGKYHGRSHAVGGVPA
jgi:dihydroxy-acid dehydratase